MDYAALKTLIASEPENEGRDDAAVLAWLLETVDVLQPIPSTTLLRWGAQNARLARLRDAAENHASDDVRSIADAAVLTVERGDTSIDMADPLHVGLVDGLIAGGVLTEGDKADLVDEATATRPRWMGAFAQEPILGDVGAARRL